MAQPAPTRQLDLVTRGPEPTEVSLRVNGEAHTLSVEPRTTLLDALRTELGLTGAKQGCDEGTCGTCTVLVDGQAVYGCLTLAIAAEGREVTTIEGLASEEGQLHPIQAAFVERDALQCGFCTPGQILSVKALLDANPDPSKDEIRQAVAGNLCRCGAYPKIVEAARDAAERLRAG